MATFPSIVPTSRNYQPGDWPIKRFTSQNGSEVRILRGNSRLNSQLDLTYDNISDTYADQFLAHYREVQGTFRTWSLPAAGAGKTFTDALEGWGGSSIDDGATTAPYGMAWRYAEPPQVTQVKKGISNVRIRLIGVLKDASTIASAGSVAPIPPTPASVPRFTSFYGIDWAASADSVEVDWRDDAKGYSAFAARTTVGVAAWTFANGKNLQPGLQWEIAGFGTTPQTFEIVCVDTTRAGASSIKTASTYTSAVLPYQGKYLHWRVSGPASEVLFTGSKYRILQRSDISALPTSWTASSLGHEYDTKKGSGNGWLGPFPTDGAVHKYAFVITALDAGGNPVANAVSTSVGLFKFP